MFLPLLIVLCGTVFVTLSSALPEIFAVLLKTWTQWKSNDSFTNIFFFACIIYLFIRLFYSSFKLLYFCLQLPFEPISLLQVFVLFMCPLPLMFRFILFLSPFLVVHFISLLLFLITVFLLPFKITHCPVSKFPIRKTVQLQRWKLTISCPRAVCSHIED